MYDLKQADVSRAIDILRNGAISAADFSKRMWPDRKAADGGERSRGSHTLAGSAFLHRIGALGYVEKVGDLWVTRSAFSGSPAVLSPSHSPSHFQSFSPSYSPSDRAGSFPGSLPGEPAVSSPGATPGQSAERTRLIRLVELAVEPVESITCDSALGDLRIRSIAVDAALVEACAIVVLSGHQANVYPPCGAPQMIVGLSPAEAARALFLRWQQSGQPPELPRVGAWIRIPDGIVASSGFWRPAGAPAGWVDPEDVRARVQRQRAAAGLA